LLEKYAFLAPLNTLTFHLPHLQIDYCQSNLLLQTELTVHTGILLSIQQEKADTQDTSSNYRLNRTKLDDKDNMAPVRQNSLRQLQNLIRHISRLMLWNQDFTEKSRSETGHIWKGM
jgi:hypothetical protein